MSLKLFLFLALLSPWDLAFAQGSNRIAFEATRLRVGGAEVLAEIADSEARQNRGLMFRTKLTDSEGMLFLYPYEQRLIFWMKNTKIPLAIGFFNKEKKLIDIKEMKVEDPSTPDDDLPRYASDAPAMYALEVPAGWFERKKIKIGAELVFVKSKNEKK